MVSVLNHTRLEQNKLKIEQNGVVTLIQLISLLFSSGQQHAIKTTRQIPSTQSQIPSPY